MIPRIERIERWKLRFNQIDKGLGLRTSRLHRGLQLEYFSLAWMVVEALVSVAAGIQAGSLALIAFGGDSFIELISAYAVATYLRSILGAGGGSSELDQGAGSVPDSTRTEKVATALLFALIPVIALGAMYSYFMRITAEGSLLGIAVAIGAAIVMPYLWIGKLRVGRETECLPLQIDATESATCFFMAVTLLGGLLAVFFLKMGWIDYVATAIILIFVASEAIESTRETRENKRPEYATDASRLAGWNASR